MPLFFFLCTKEVPWGLSVWMDGCVCSVCEHAEAATDNITPPRSWHDDLSAKVVRSSARPSSLLLLLHLPPNIDKTQQAQATPTHPCQINAQNVPFLPLPLPLSLPSPPHSPSPSSLVQRTKSLAAHSPGGCSVPPQHTPNHPSNHKPTPTHLSLRHPESVLLSTHSIHLYNPTQTNKTKSKQWRTSNPSNPPRGPPAGPPRRLRPRALTRWKRWPPSPPSSRYVREGRRVCVGVWVWVMWGPDGSTSITLTHPTHPPTHPTPVQASGKEYDPDLLWFIHGRAYDLSDWMQHHPGGQDALGNAQGRDSTALFESYHFFTDRARNMLAKMTPVEVPPEVSSMWMDRGERGGSNELLYVLYGWVGGWSPTPSLVLLLLLTLPTTPTHPPTHPLHRSSRSTSTTPARPTTSTCPTGRKTPSGRPSAPAARRYASSPTHPPTNPHSSSFEPPSSPLPNPPTHPPTHPPLLFMSMRTILPLPARPGGAPTSSTCGCSWVSSPFHLPPPLSPHPPTHSQHTAPHSNSLLLTHPPTHLLQVYEDDPTLTRTSGWGCYLFHMWLLLGLQPIIFYFGFLSNNALISHGSAILMGMTNWMGGRLGHDAGKPPTHPPISFLFPCVLNHPASHPNTYLPTSDLLYLLNHPPTHPQATTPSALRSTTAGGLQPSCLGLD